MSQWRWVNLGHSVRTESPYRVRSKELKDSQNVMILYTLKFKFATHEISDTTRSYTSGVHVNLRILGLCFKNCFCQQRNSSSKIRISRMLHSACSTHARRERCIWNSGRETWKKENTWMIILEWMLRIRVWGRGLSSSGSVQWTFGFGFKWNSITIRAWVVWTGRGIMSLSVSTCRRNTGPLGALTLPT